MFVFRAPFHSHHLDIIAYFDKTSNFPVVFVTNACADSQKFSNLPHCSQNFEGKTKPGIVILYNKSMGGVDCIDQSRNVGKKWTHFAKRMTLNLVDHLFHNLFILHKKFQIKTNVKLPKNNHRAFLEKFCYELLGPKIEIPPVVNPLPLPDIETAASHFISKRTKEDMSASTNSLIVISPATSRKRTMCVLCPKQREGGKRSAIACAICKKIVCVDHRETLGKSFICKKCKV